MIHFFRKAPTTVELRGSENKMYSAIQNAPESPQELKIDLTSGNELSPEGKIFCARLCAQNNLQEFKLPKNMEIGRLQNDALHEPIDFSLLSENFRKMELEEAALFGVKQYLSETRKDLQNLLFKEIARKRINIACLRSEIRTLQNSCKELSKSIQFLE
jgi:hypothetical protein